jgi:response regulator of citrate/malate metabolism
MARPTVSINTLVSLLSKYSESEFTIEALVNSTVYSEVTVRKSISTLLDEGRITVNTSSRPYTYRIKSQEATVL